MQEHAGHVDWNTGTWERQPGTQPESEIIIAGDWAPIRDFSSALLEKPEAVYGDLLPELRGAHLRVANLECPLTNADTPVPKSGSVLKGLPEHVRGLTIVPFEGVTLANNHVFDHGVEAFTETRDLLHRNGVRSTGAGLSLAEAERPMQITANGVDIAVIAFGEGEDLTAASRAKPGVLGWEPDRVIGLVRHIRSRFHVVIVVCHGGVEYIPFPPPYVADALRRIARAGADLVIGHHPHVPQGVEIHHGTPICYSLGNFVFFQPTDLLYRKIGYLVKTGVTRKGLTRIRIIPYQIEPKRLMQLKGQKLRQAFEKLRMLSVPLSGDRGIADAWHGFLKTYGVAGFKNEMGGILDRINSDPEKGAAMFRNRLTTPQHVHHLSDLMTRITQGRLDTAPGWAADFVSEYFNRKVTEEFPE